MKTTLIIELLSVILILITALPGTITLFNKANWKFNYSILSFDLIANRLRSLLKKEMAIQP